MAVGLGPLSTLHPVPGFELGIASAGIKRPGRKDVVVMRCAEGSSVAGVFTLNAFCAAPVTLAKQRFLGEVRYLLTNTGNANAGTGEAGLAAAAQTCAKLAELAALVLVFRPPGDQHPAIGATNHGRGDMYSFHGSSPRYCRHAPPEAADGHQLPACSRNAASYQARNAGH